MIPASNTAFRYAIGLIVAMLVLCAFVVAYRLYVTIGMCEAIEQARSNSSTSMNSVSDIETGSSYKHPRSLISMPKPIASIGQVRIPSLPHRSAPVPPVNSQKDAVETPEPILGPSNLGRPPHAPHSLFWDENRGLAHVQPSYNTFDTSSVVDSYGATLASTKRLSGFGRSQSPSTSFTKRSSIIVSGGIKPLLLVEKANRQSLGSESLNDDNLPPDQFAEFIDKITALEKVITARDMTVSNQQVSFANLQTQYDHLKGRYSRLAAAFAMTNGPLEATPTSATTTTLPPVRPLALGKQRSTTARITSMSDSTSRWRSSQQFGPRPMPKRPASLAIRPTSTTTLIDPPQRSPSLILTSPSIPELKVPDLSADDYDMNLLAPPPRTSPKSRSKRGRARSGTIAPLTPPQTPSAATLSLCLPPPRSASLSTTTRTTKNRLEQPPITPSITPISSAFDNKSYFPAEYIHILGATTTISSPEASTSLFKNIYPALPSATPIPIPTRQSRAGSTSIQQPVQHLYGAGHPIEEVVKVAFADHSWGALEEDNEDDDEEDPFYWDTDYGVQSLVGLGVAGN